MTEIKAVAMQVMPGSKHPDHQEIYSNTTKAGFGPWDIRLIFGHIIEGALPNQQVAEDLVTVVMSPQHAKVLIASWEKIIKAYEDQFGIIPDLTSVVEAMAAAVAASQKS
jgi:Protein of unknown function (DUF3467)